MATTDQFDLLGDDIEDPSQLIITDQLKAAEAPAKKVSEKDQGKHAQTNKLAQLPSKPPPPTQAESTKSGAQTGKVQPIEVPQIQADKLIEATYNFGQDSLIGEGSYGRVYYGVLQGVYAILINFYVLAVEDPKDSLRQKSTLLLD